MILPYIKTRNLKKKGGEQKNEGEMQYQRNGALKFFDGTPLLRSDWVTQQWLWTYKEVCSG